MRFDPESIFDIRNGLIFYTSPPPLHNSFTAMLYIKIGSEKNLNI